MNDTASHHRALRAAPLVVLALLAAGCGGAGTATHTSGSQTTDVQAVQWSQCMHQHGIDANASMDPSGRRNIQINAGGASDQQLRAAESACRQYLPNGGQSASPPSAQRLDQMAKYAQCLNQHGIPAQQHGGSVFTEGPEVDPNKMQRAQQACEHYLPTPEPASSPGSGSGS